MFREGYERSDIRRLSVYWWSLSLQAGFINVGGLMSCARSVSHVTGFFSNFAIKAAENDLTQAAGLFSVPFFFLIGASITTFFIEKSPNSHQPEGMLRAKYHWVLYILTFLLVLVAGLGVLGVFGSFEGSVDFGRHYLLLVLLSFACGLQNGMFSDRTGAVIRSTHLTGPITDLGIGIARLFQHRHFKYSKIFLRESRIVLLRLGSIGFFIVGGLLATLIFSHMSYWGFIAPAILSFCLALDARKIEKGLKV